MKNLFTLGLITAAMTTAFASRGEGVLKVSYATEDEIPTAYRDLFTEQSGKFILTGVQGIKTQADVDRLQDSLRKEREDHKKTKSLLSGFEGLDADEIRAKLDRFAELEAAAGGKLDEAKINEMVEARLNSRTAPLQREITKLKETLGERETVVAELTTREKTRKIHDHIRQAASKAKLRDSAIEDALLIGERVMDIDESGNVVTREGVGATPGINAEVWLTEQQNIRPHWWPDSVSPGAKGGGGALSGKNPFSAEHWNMTEQGRLVTENRTKAEQMAASAGTTIGGPRPAPKK